MDWLSPVLDPYSMAFKTSKNRGKRLDWLKKIHHLTYSIPVSYYPGQSGSHRQPLWSCYPPAGWAATLSYLFHTTQSSQGLTDSHCGPVILQQDELPPSPTCFMLPRAVRVSQIATVVLLSSSRMSYHPLLPISYYPGRSGSHRQPLWSLLSSSRMSCHPLLPV